MHFDSKLQDKRFCTEWQQAFPDSDLLLISSGIEFITASVLGQGDRQYSKYWPLLMRYEIFGFVKKTRYRSSALGRHNSSAIVHVLVTCLQPWMSGFNSRPVHVTSRCEEHKAVGNWTGFLPSISALPCLRLPPNAPVPIHLSTTDPT